MDAFLPSVLNNSVDILENSDLILNSLCSELKSSDDTVTSNVDLHLECEEDGGSISIQAGTDFYLSHEFVGENIQLAISFPNPSSSTIAEDDCFCCSFCSSTFHRQQLLFRHLQEEHDVKQSYTCDVCSYAGTSSRLLSRHKVRKHRLSKEVKTNEMFADIKDSTTKGSLLPDKVFLNTSLGKHADHTRPSAERIMQVDRIESLDKNLCISSNVILGGNQPSDNSMSVSKNITCSDDVMFHQSDSAISNPALTIIKNNMQNDHAGNFFNVITSLNKCSSMPLLDTMSDFAGHPTQDGKSGHAISSRHVNDSFHGMQFRCTACVYAATSKRLLKYHMNTMHNPERQLFQCIHCSYNCRQKRTLDLHLLKHTGSETRICPHCQKKFYSLLTLRRHLLIHTNEKRFQCSFHACLKTFKTVGALGDHKRKVHCIKGQIPCPNTCLKKVVCEYPGCGKTFRDGSNLKTHHCLHTGEKPVKCSLCSFSCVQKTSLNYHMKKCHVLS